MDHEWGKHLEDTEWMSRARCAETDSEVFFPHEGGVSPVRIAKRICGGCEVQAECLEYALMNDMEYGIWGGASAYDRQRIARRRQRTA